MSVGDYIGKTGRAAVLGAGLMLTACTSSVDELLAKLDFPQSNNEAILLAAILDRPIEGKVCKEYGSTKLCNLRIEFSDELMPGEAQYFVAARRDSGSLNGPTSSLVWACSGFGQHFFQVYGRRSEETLDGVGFFDTFTPYATEDQLSQFLGDNVHYNRRRKQPNYADVVPRQHASNFRKYGFLCAQDIVDFLIRMGAVSRNEKQGEAQLVF